MHKKSCEQVAAVILAAGAGRRFGGCKATAQIDGISFLERIAVNIKATACDPIIAVGGSDIAAITSESERLKISYVNNPGWEKGQFSSLQQGLAAIDDDICGAMITLVDHPLVALETYQLLMEAFTKHPGMIMIPSYSHRRGHPIVIPREIMRLVVESPADTTLREIIARHEPIVMLCRTDDPGILRDIDTREDLKRR